MAAGPSLGDSSVSKSKSQMREEPGELTTRVSAPPLRFSKHGSNSGKLRLTNIIKKISSKYTDKQAIEEQQQALCDQQHIARFISKLKTNNRKIKDELNKLGHFTLPKLPVATP